MSLRWSLLALAALLTASSAAAQTGPFPIDPDAPSLEFVMREETEDTLLGPSTVYHYELHPTGTHGAVHGKFYGSSQVEVEGQKVFRLEMPYANPEAVALDDAGTTNASIIFGVTNRGEGDYQATWTLWADAKAVARGPAQDFHLEGQGTDAGWRLVTWQTATDLATIPADAALLMEIHVAFTGNAPFLKDRGVRIDLPPHHDPEATPETPSTTEPSQPGPLVNTTEDPGFVDTEEGRPQGRQESIPFPFLAAGLGVLLAARRR